MKSVRVVYEKDYDVDYSTYTVFNATFFDQSPECTLLLNEDEVSFTLVSQTSLERLWLMKHHCQRWKVPNPISIAIFLPPNSSSTQYTPESIVQELNERWECQVHIRMTITILIGTSPMDRYPVNLLRNLAIQGVRTTHFAYTDLDFLISDGLYDDLMSAAPYIAKDPYAAIVIPAFVY